MPKIPQAVAESPLTLKLKEHLGTPRVGKVRHAYNLPGFDDYFLSVVTDRGSAFDIVWNAFFDMKGWIINCQDICVATQIMAKTGLPHDLIAWGAAIDVYLPEPLRGDSDLQTRATVRKRLIMDPIEFVYRQYLVGTGWKSYKKDQTICGVKLPPGINEGDRFADAFFSPTDKAEEGHDEPVDAEQIRRQYRRRVEMGTELFLAVSKHHDERDLIEVDSKYELGRDKNGSFIFGDERSTCDSSRKWRKSDYAAARAKGKLPSSMDKQLFRNWLMTQMTEFGPASGLDPKNPAHVAAAHNLTIPGSIIDDMAGVYTNCLYECFGEDIDVFRRSIGIQVP